MKNVGQLVHGLADAPEGDQEASVSLAGQQRVVRSGERRPPMSGTVAEIGRTGLVTVVTCKDGL